MTIMTHQQIDHTEIITEIIALISVVITVLITNIIQCLQPSSTTPTVTPLQAQQDIGLTDTTGPKPLMVVTQKQSKSTIPGKTTAGQKKAAGGTKSVKQSPRTSSSPRSNVSGGALNLPSSTSLKTSLLLQIHEVSPPFMPRSEQDLPWTIPPSGLTIARS
jgi:hypothetical protein